MNLDISRYKISNRSSISLAEFDPAFKDGFPRKKAAKEQLARDIKAMSDLQYKLYAENRNALLIIFQAMDAAGKDSSIKHVLSGINPQGCEVHSFKHPSLEELEHDYIWRHYTRLPDRGRIGIFNRSYYENVLISKVHPEFLLAENLPGIFSVKDVDKDFWEKRYSQINQFEKTISENGTTILKFFLHLSKEEQKKRFLDRLNQPDKNWKFSLADINERAYWDDYQQAYEIAIGETSTADAPWYIIPADRKWFSRAVIGSIIVETLEKMDLRIPVLTQSEKSMLQEAKSRLEKE